MIDKIPAFVDAYMKTHTMHYSNQTLSSLQTKQGLMIALSFLLLQLDKQKEERHNQLIYLLEHHTILESSAYQRIYLTMNDFAQRFKQSPTGLKIERVSLMPMLFDGLDFQSPYRHLSFMLKEETIVACLKDGQYLKTTGQVQATPGLEVIVLLQKAMSHVTCRIRLASIQHHMEIVSFHIKEVAHEKK